MGTAWRDKDDKKRKTDQKIGDRIRETRSRYSGGNVDFRSFADALDVTPAAVHQWEHGSGITHYRLVKIARTYNVSIEWLLGLTESHRSLNYRIRREVPGKELRREAFAHLENTFEAWKAEKGLQPWSAWKVRDDHGEGEGI